MAPSPTGDRARRAAEATRRLWREARLVGRAVAANLVWFAALLAACAALLGASGCFPDQGVGERLVTAFYMVRVEGVPDAARNRAVRDVLVFVMPALGLAILGEGALRVAAIYLGRRRHGGEWEALMASGLSGHTVICGGGELGRALLLELLRRDREAAVVVVDTHPDILADIGAHGPEVHCVHGDMTARRTLEQANVARAGTVIVTSGDDARNLETAARVLQISPATEVWVRLYRIVLSEMLDSAARSNIHFFSPYQRAAETLLDRLGPAGKAGKP